MKTTVSILISGLSLIACKPVVDVTIMPGPSIAVPAQQDVDSTYSYLYGSKAVGLAVSSLFGTKQGDGVRLKQLISNGKVIGEYTYDDRNRLIEAKSFGEGYTLGTTRYVYQGDLVSKAEYWVNVAAQSGFETLSSNELVLTTTALYSYDAGSGLATKTIKRENSAFDDLVYQTGFDEKGRAIWTEEKKYTLVYVNPQLRVRKASSSYFYTRDNFGNIVNSSTTYLFLDPKRSTASCTYDTKRNPKASLMPFPGDAFSPSNMVQVVEDDGSRKTIRTFEYSYRPDGYPLWVKEKTSTSESIKITEFVYNK